MCLLPPFVFVVLAGRAAENERATKLLRISKILNIVGLTFGIVSYVTGFVTLIVYIADMGLLDDSNGNSGDGDNSVVVETTTLNVLPTTTTVLPTTTTVLPTTTIDK